MFSFGVSSIPEPFQYRVHVILYGGAVSQLRLCFSVVKPVRDARLVDLKVKVNHEIISKNVGGLFEKVCMV